LQENILDLFCLVNRENIHRFVNRENIHRFVNKENIHRFVNRENIYRFDIREFNLISLIVTLSLRLYSGMGGAGIAKLSHFQANRNGGIRVTEGDRGAPNRKR
jgi:hypothetical protein